MKNHAWTLAGLALLFSVALACTADEPAAREKTTGPGQTSTGATRIQAGKTTKSDVRSICGEPAGVRSTNNGEEWSYRYPQDGALTVAFDGTGTVADYRYQGTTRVSPEAPAPTPTAGEKPGTIHCDLCPIYCTRSVCTLSGCREEQYICQWYSCNCGGY